MKSALGFDATHGDLRRKPFAPLDDRYSIIGKLNGTGRAEVSLGLPAQARGIEELVVIKRYGSASRDGHCIADHYLDGQNTERSRIERSRVEHATLQRGRVEVPHEVEVASTPHHQNLARVVECGWEAGRYFIISEYLEGTTLRRLLRWLAAGGETLPNAATARILLGIFAAVEHANQWARTPRARALVHQPIDASNVFITCTGAVKVLGFKPPKANDAAPAALPAESAAVDDLLSTQRSTELAAVLARIGNRLSSASLIGLWQVARVLRDWQEKELRSDGDSELAAVMAKVQPEKRALQRARIEAAVARVIRARDDAEPSADAQPVSGYRIARSDVEVAAIIRYEPLHELERPLPALVVQGPEVVSHLQRSPSPPARNLTLSPLRRRAMPWAPPAVLAGALIAALVIARHRGTRVEAATLAVSERPAAPVKQAVLAPAPSLDRSAPAAAESLPLQDPLPQGDFPPAPASSLHAPVVARDAASSSAAWHRRPPEGRPGKASLVRAAAPGYLTLDTSPWSAVSAGGVSLGHTPLVKVELAPGEHLLELVNEELGIATSVLVEITSGSTTVRRIGLEWSMQAARQ